MKKFVFALLFVSIVPSVATAQQGISADIDPSLQSSCVELSKNMRYKMRDTNTSGQVSELQDFLNAEGYLDSKPTGYFGLGTQKAVKNFQSAVGVSPTGYVGQLTRERIKELSCGVSPKQATTQAKPQTNAQVAVPKAPPVISPQAAQTTEVAPITAKTPTELFSNKKFSSGMTDPEVKKLQALLAMDGSIYPERTISGTYDFYTVQAVKKFQDRFNLATPELKKTPNYGIVGPKTTEMIYKVFVERSVPMLPAAQQAQHQAAVVQQPVRTTINTSYVNLQQQVQTQAQSNTQSQTSTQTNSTQSNTTQTNTQQAQTQAQTNTQQTPTTYSLTVAKSGTGAGSVSSGTVISCGSTCSASITKDTNVTLTAAASTGSVFSNWTGACTGAGTCTVVMSSAQSVTAVFTIIPPTMNTLSVTGGTGGTVTSSPLGINSCAAACSFDYVKDTQVTLTAAKQTGYDFTGWSGACLGTATTCTVTMDTAKNVTAVFTLTPPPAAVTFALSVTKSGTGTGSVSSSAGISCGQVCSADVEKDTVVLLTATPNNNSTFTNWTGACTGSANPCSTTMSAARSANAVFTLIPVYTITATQSANGTISPIIASEVMQGGDSPTYSITPNANYDILELLIDGVKTLAANIYSFTNVQSNRAISATFAPVVHKLTVVGTGGTITSNPNGITCGATCSFDFQQGAQITLTAIANTGYTFASWTGCAGSGNTCSVSMDASKNVSANFTAPAPTATLTASPASITSGQSTTLTWSSTNATSCSATGGWTSQTTTSGTQSVSPTANQTYTVSCTGAGGTASQSVSVGVTAAVSAPAVVIDNSGVGITKYSIPSSGIAIDTITNSVWVTNSNSVSKVSIGDGTKVDYSVACGLDLIAFDSITKSVWCTHTGSVSKINIYDGTSVSYNTGITSPSSIVFDNITSSVWVLDNSGSPKNIAKVNINDGTSVSYPVAANGYDLSAGIAFDPITKSVWVPNSIYVSASLTNSSVSKIDIYNGTKVDYPLANGYPRGVVFDSITNSVWVAGYRYVSGAAVGTLSKVNINNGTRIDYTVGKGIGRMAFDPSTSSVWVLDNWSSSYIEKVNIYNGTKVDYPVDNTSMLSIAFDPVSNSVWITRKYVKPSLTKMGVNTSVSAANQALGTLTFTTNKSGLNNSSSNNSFTLSWSSTGMTSCIAWNNLTNLPYTRPWNGSRATSGAETITLEMAWFFQSYGARDFSLSCTGDGGTIISSVTVYLQQLVL